MEIEVISDSLNDLSKYLDNENFELEQDYNFINDLSIQISKYLHGRGQAAISSRITNFNNNQFRKIVNYTKTLSTELSSTKIYDSEESDFSEKMNREAIKYEQSKY